MTRLDAIKLLKLAASELQLAERQVRQRRDGAERRHHLAQQLFEQARAQAVLVDLSPYAHDPIRA